MGFKTVLVDAYVRCEPDVRDFGDIEYRAKQLERWIYEFQEFMRDHRSRDGVAMAVVRETQQQCVHCHREWEEIEYEEDETGPGYLGCSYCAKPTVPGADVEVPAEAAKT